MRARFGVASIVVVFVGLVLGLAWLAANNPDLLRLYRADVVQPILLTLALVVLVSVLVATTQIFSRLQLADARQPLGLPEGSVRAVIALALVLIFALMVVYLYGAVAYPLEVISPGVPAADLASLPPGQIVKLEPVPGSSPAVYNVTLAAPKSTASDNFALQALTTVSTLAVAVASFYFGTQSTRSGTEAGAAAAAGPRIALSSPAPGALSVKDRVLQPVDFRLDAGPATSAISGRVVAGDPGGQVTSLGPGRFVYSPGAPVGDAVVLRFSLSDHPDVTLDVVLLVPTLE